MNLEKVFFAFFIVLALTLNFGFFTGEIDNPAHHHSIELIAAIIINPSSATALIWVLCYWQPVWLRMYS